MTNPLRTNVKPKQEIINWSAIPDTPCELEYRPVSETDSGSVLSLLVKLGFLGFIFLILQGLAHWLLLNQWVSSISFDERLFVGICLALLQLFRPMFLKRSIAAGIALGFSFSLWLG